MLLNRKDRDARKSRVSRRSDAIPAELLRILDLTSTFLGRGLQNHVFPASTHAFCASNPTTLRPSRADLLHLLIIATGKLAPDLAFMVPCFVIPPARKRLRFSSSGVTRDWLEIDVDRR